MELSLDAIGSARAVLIAGPTASGKSAMALQLAAGLSARRRSSVIVNADAMQVYEGLRILTARPAEADERLLPHRLYGHVAPSTRYSVGVWLGDMAKVLEEARAAQALPIVVGGAGLYFKALTEGLAAVPDIPLDVRARFAERLAREGVAALHALLAERDPASAAAIRPSDPQRVLRALEVLEVTGSSLAMLQAAPALPPLLALSETAPFVIEADRPTLHRRIDARFEHMVAEGAMEEVRALLALGLDATLPALKAIGVREFSAVLNGEAPLASAVARAKTETRRYAKRQSTWFRHQMRGWQRIESREGF